MASWESASTDFKREQESSSTEPLLSDPIKHGTSETKSLSRTGSKILRRDISRMVLDTGGDYRVSQKLSKHGPSYLGTLRGKDLEMAKQLSEHTRLVDKKGRNQVSFKDMEEQSAMYMKDIFTTFVDAHWYYVLIAFFASFFGLWLLFGLFYWAIAWHHNDIEAYNNPQNFTDHTSCVDQVFDFTTAFLFALEGQTTIGYGFRSTTEECPIAIILQFIQFLTAIALDSLVVTIVFTKLARPKYRAKTVEFSTKAVILERDGQLCLIVRACNLRNSLLIDVNVSGKLLKTRRSLDGEWLALEERNVEFANSNVLFLTQPVDYVHIINEESPLYELSQEVLSSGEPLELIVIMAGIVEGTGMACQVRTSYVCSEILWGHRFEPAITRNKNINKYQVDYEKFNSIIEISPPMSPKSAEERDNEEDDEIVDEENVVINESDESPVGYFPDNVKTVC
ncbi:Oidioi.mRNA.OKI2018_I69.chr2.g7643.t1.cds [Oikopleura dioica]|uniref:Oidioi.mRNA.OKI2018_I69.chr2.g7643.t1.cds n=1 Tax=Oikopleura dioica TaxID=34765 RepID=A0ABN7TBG9_OIKDI|nr:Oidioi.mRNA.OKI2018_I69.chr2.g7643.t1.cds [Oikopleura dioica]